MVAGAQGRESDSQSLLKPNAGACSEWFVGFEGSLQTNELNPDKI